MRSTTIPIEVRVAKETIGMLESISDALEAISDALAVIFETLNCIHDTLHPELESDAAEEEPYPYVVVNDDGRLEEE